SRTFTRDSTPPAVSITSPAAGTKDKVGITLSGTCETGLQVDIGGAGIGTPISVGCNASQFSVPIAFSAGDGNKIITVTQTDSVGNPTTDPRTFARNNQAPPVTITSPLAGMLTKGPITLSGNCSAGLTVVIAGDVSQSVNATCPAGTFSSVISLSSGDGSKN